MKISKKTIDILKNFADINTGLLIQPGKVQKTMSVDKCELAIATLEEEFPTQFGIYNLSLLLSNISIIKDVDFKFVDSILIISDAVNPDKAPVIYYNGCQPALIMSPPNKELDFEPDLSFDVSAEQINAIKKIADVNQLLNLEITGNQDGIFLNALDRKNPDSNKASLKIDDKPRDSFTIYLDFAHLKILPQNFRVDVKHERIVRFSNQDVIYYIAVQAPNK